MEIHSQEVKGTIKLQKLELGDIIAYHNPNGFLPRGIQYFMKKWAHIHYKVRLPSYYNHTFMMIDPYSLRIAEAIGKGFTVHSFWSSYTLSDIDNMMVFRLKEPLTEDEKLKLLIKRQELADKNVEYEVLNFFWWIPYILSNGRIDLGPKGGKTSKKVFCFETSCLLTNAAREVFEKPDRTTSVDIQMSGYYNQFKLLF